MPVTRPNQIIAIRPILSDILRSALLSLRKTPTITDTFLARPSDILRFRSSTIGDIAKLCVKTWLERNGFVVTDWDDVRSSFRSSRKRFDLEVNGTKIEVASSVAKKVDGLTIPMALQRIIDSEHIIQPVRKTKKDIVIQVFFLSSENPDAYLAGWCEWDNLSPHTKIRRIAGRPTDFWMLPFNHADAHPMRDILGRL